MKTTYEPLMTTTPVVCYAVIDAKGNVSHASSAEHARAKAICHDHDYPSLGPHRAVTVREMGPA